MTVDVRGTVVVSVDVRGTVVVSDSVELVVTALEIVAAINWNPLLKNTASVAARGGK